MIEKYTCGFNLYYPQARRDFAFSLIKGMPGVGAIEYKVIRDFVRGITDFGEINPNYTGLREMPRNMVLHMSAPSGKSLGIMVLEPGKDRLVRIDITLLREDCRGKGLGKHLYACVEKALADGTVLYVEHVTFYGSKFFKKCGFNRDVDLIKILSSSNRIDVDPGECSRILKACV
ncbi:hypothetical protein DCCM_2663 [Desulfocucumis palustris]|uniref:N-acetyltransferase domain-containing protein n=1 Tax=Desulfocucumis palustris TaxID=1898651 RepID=A0A2L2XI45_9FIRM|nr:GNAT family N-acetyltransferase [Desulfocucumis palustris]GBF33561.1 hypothetical protein DCCM_2663 [Desulfocucumis palustris]